MINLPYISYGVFLITLVAIFILGVKKGFMTAVFSLVVLFVSVGISIGFAYAIYTPLKSNFASILGSAYSGSGSYDFTAIVESTRPQALSILICVFVIPVYLVIFFASKRVARKAKIFDYHKTVQVAGSNTKVIVKTTLRTNKYFGLGITTLSSVLAAATTSSAIVPLVTKVDKYNGFHQMLGGLSLFSTFGQAYTSQRMIDLYSFIPLTKEDSMMSVLGWLVRPGTELLEQSAIDKFHTDKTNLDKIISLFNNNDVDAMVKVISTKSDKAVWKPFGEEFVDDENSADYGKDISGDYKLQISAMQNAWKLINFHISQSAANDFANAIKSYGVQSFENTKYYTEHQKINTLINAAKDSLFDAKNKASEARQNASDFQNAMNESINQRAQTETRLLSAIEEYNIQTTDAENKKRVVDSTKAELDAKQKTYNSLSDKWNNYHNNFWAPRNNELLVAKQAAQQNHDDITNLNNLIPELSAKFALLDSQSDDLSEDIANLNSKITNTHPKNEQERLAQEKDIDQLSQLQKSEEKLESDKQSLQLQKQQKISNLNQLQSLTSGLINAQSTAQSAFDSVDYTDRTNFNDKESASRDMTIAQQNYDAAVGAYNQSENTANSIFSRISISISTLNSNDGFQIKENFKAWRQLTQEGVVNGTITATANFPYNFPTQLNPSGHMVYYNSISKPTSDGQHISAPSISGEFANEQLATPYANSINYFDNPNGDKQNIFDRIQKLPFISETFNLYDKEKIKTKNDPGLIQYWNLSLETLQKELNSWSIIMDNKRNEFRGIVNNYCDSIRLSVTK